MTVKQKKNAQTVLIINNLGNIIRWYRFGHAVALLLSLYKFSSYLSKCFS